jgi:hypothetical protein
MPEDRYQVSEGAPSVIGSLTSDIWLGGVAQLGERLLCKQEVIGSIPFTSTTAQCARAHCREARTERSRSGEAREVAGGLCLLAL